VALAIVGDIHSLYWYRH